ncbi:MAG: DUF4349 domain-containing protein [bacterium]
MKSYRHVVTVVVFLLFLFFLQACSSQSSSSKQSESNTMYSGDQAFNQPGAPSVLSESRNVIGTTAQGASDKTSVTNLAASDRMVVKTGQLALVVKDLNVVRESLVKIVSDKQGYVATSSSSPSSTSPTMYITVKVPAISFEEILNAIKQSAVKVVSERIEGQDVTEEYVDLKAQLKNLLATEQQLLEIMKKATTITDILSVQRELKQVRDEIERIQGRTQYLEKSSSMSTITVSLALEEKELPIVAERWDPLATIKAALRDMAKFWQMIGDLLIWLVIVLGPVVLLGYGIWVGVKKWRRK